MSVKNNIVYTAQELRQTAQGLFVRGVVATVPANVQYGRREKEVYAVQLKEMLLQAADAMEREDKEIDELKKQVSIAKDAFFKIAQRKHSREVHDIICEAEFMMNHPECREAVTK